MLGQDIEVLTTKKCVLVDDDNYVTEGGHVEDKGVNLLAGTPAYARNEAALVSATRMCGVNIYLLIKRIHLPAVTSASCASCF